MSYDFTPKQFGQAYRKFRKELLEEGEASFPLSSGSWVDVEEDSLDFGKYRVNSYAVKASELRGVLYGFFLSDLTIKGI
jgi:hypothetical protein